MSFHNRVKADAYIASGDLSGLQFRFVDLITNAPFKVGHALADKGFGVLGNAPRSGEHAEVQVEGEVEVKAGVAVQAGQLIGSAASGWATPISAQSVQVASGTVLITKTVLGRAVTGAASGSLFTMVFDRQHVTVASA